MNEEWKTIKDFEGRYEVSNLGNVRSLERYSYMPNGSKIIIKPRILKQSTCYYGYFLVTLYNVNRKLNVKVHRLVAQAFIPNHDNKPTVNHVDGIKKNNRIDNLEWATYSENTQHAWDIGLCTPNDRESVRGEKNCHSKLTESKVLFIRHNYKGNGGTLKAMELVKMFDVSLSTVMSAIRFRSWKHV